MNEDLSEETGSEDEFGDEVDGVVTVTTETFGRGSVSKFLVELWERFVVMERDEWQESAEWYQRSE